MTINELIKRAFEEDIPSIDKTTEALKKKEAFGVAQLIAKQDLTLSGCDFFEQSLHHRDPNLNINWNFKDGDSVINQQIIAQIDGNLLELLKAERVALNFMGYFSGIATLTSFFAKACEGTSCRILDTRKTIPLYREFSKRAVAHGGGVNHRMNLSDGILIKENHITVAGSLETTVLNSRERFPDDFIEVETKNLQEVQKAVDLKVNRIMLDNMSLDETAKALEIIPNEIEVEASGNMTLDRIPDVAQLGVDFISVGALTHSAPTADISLIFDWN